MNLLKSFGTGLCVTVLCLLVTPQAQAGDWSRKTVLTFSAPIEVPGTVPQVLPAGTYVFKALDSTSDRHVVQIFNKDETHLFTTALAIANYRLTATDKTVITFRERPDGQPEALKAWFYPGHKWGDQFVYEKSKALQLAKETNEIVLTTPIIIVAAPVEVVQSAPIEAVTPTGDTVDTAQIVTAPPVETPAAKPMLVAALPKTASDLGAIGLSGMMLLGAGFLLSGLCKKIM